MNGPNKMLMVFMDHADQYRGVPLYEAIMTKLVGMDVAGATVLEGLMGYGSSRAPGPDDRPVAVLAVDSEDKLNEVTPEIRPMVRDGIVMLMDVDVVGQTASRLVH